MSLDTTISALQSRMARRSNLIAELEDEYGFRKARATVKNTRALHHEAYALRQEINEIVRDQKLDKSIFAHLVHERTMLQREWSGFGPVARVLVFDLEAFPTCGNSPSLSGLTRQGSSLHPPKAQPGGWPEARLPHWGFPTALGE